MSLARFESEVLANQDSMQAHLDYNDWFYWQAVSDEKTRQLAELRALDLT
jgi:hypothetical protein